MIPFYQRSRGAEFKLLAIIIRQTYGWQKKRDRLNYTQFIQKTGLSRRIIAHAIQSLIDKQLIQTSDYSGNILNTPESRKGKTSIFFTPCITTHAETNKKISTFKQKAMQKPTYNKTTYSKPNKQKDFNQGHKTHK